MQGEKIRDLDKCLEHHREKLNATEELLQQVRLPPKMNKQRIQTSDFSDCQHFSTGAAEPDGTGDPEAGADD